jgi:hypothetical protein
MTTQTDSGVSDRVQGSGYDRRRRLDRKGENCEG